VTSLTDFGLMAQSAVELLAERIENPGRPTQRRIIDAEVRVRE
jgi:hypothetical protein